MLKNACSAYFPTATTPNSASLAQILLELKEVSNDPNSQIDSDPAINRLEYKDSYIIQDNFSVAQSSFNEKRNEMETCHCKKSRCLKLYCQCFASKSVCNPLCRCVACENLSNNKARAHALAAVLERNPIAFDSKFRPTRSATYSQLPLYHPVASTILQQDSVSTIAHKVGCRCRKSSCLKKYCECFEASVACNANCTCLGCQNTIAVISQNIIGGKCQLSDEIMLQRQNAVQAGIKSQYNNTQSVLKKRVNLSDAFEGHQANDIAPSRHGSNDCLPSGPLLCSSNKLFLNSLQSINSYSLLPDQSFLSTQCVDESPALSNNLFIDDDQVQKSDCHFISNDTTGLIKDTVDPTPSYVNTSTSSCSQIQPTTDNIVTDQHRELTPLQPGECRELLMLPEVHQNNLSSVEKTVNADECAASTLSIAKKLMFLSDNNEAWKLSSNGKNNKSNDSRARGIVLSEGSNIESSDSNTLVEPAVHTDDHSFIDQLHRKSHSDQNDDDKENLRFSNQSKKLNIGQISRQYTTINGSNIDIQQLLTNHGVNKHRVPPKTTANPNEYALKRPISQKHDDSLGKKRRSLSSLAEEKLASCSFPVGPLKSLSEALKAKGTSSSINRIVKNRKIYNDATNDLLTSPMLTSEKTDTNNNVSKPNCPQHSNLDGNSWEDETMVSWVAEKLEVSIMKQLLHVYLCNQGTTQHVDNESNRVGDYSPNEMNVFSEPDSMPSLESVIKTLIANDQATSEIANDESKHYIPAPISSLVTCSHSNYHHGKLVNDADNNAKCAEDETLLSLMRFFLSRREDC